MVVSASIGILVAIWVLGLACVFHHLRRLDEACVCEVDLVDGSLVERHVAVMAALKRDQIPRLDDVGLAEVLEFDVLILEVEVAELTLLTALAARRAGRDGARALPCRVQGHVVDLCHAFTLLLLA